MCNVDIENRVNADDLIDKAIRKYNIDFGKLIAATSIWANKEVHEYLLKENGTGAWRPNIRRFRKKEKRRTYIDGIFLDDNTYVNKFIKTALGFDQDKFINFEVCHIWENTCYDPRYHSTIANLVLLPRSLAGLSDHNQNISDILKYRSYKLYKWKPSERSEPTRPDNYPNNWNTPYKFTNRIARSLKNRRFK